MHQIPWYAVTIEDIAYGKQYYDIETTPTLEEVTAKW